ncbi:acyl carrier protein [Lentzea sp. DG1S-22]|uniref:acyl carrier protein n=1 Tax=Lentzea sp. DG1S-22 TaxID=3108822 RepID=UPI002E75F30F|nr:acyl carrier protein [Lentzea sp. DG1S-22]WVH82420.1 acyl carrier protein [Lentzea sp. DG1S-22]
MSVPLLALLADVLDVEAGRVTEDSGRDVLPEWTSLAHIQVINAVEEAYGVVLSTHEIDQARNVAALRSFLTSRGVPL